MAHQASIVNCESTDTPTTSALMALNSSALSLNAMISVGHINVLKSNKIIDRMRGYIVFVQNK